MTTMARSKKRINYGAKYDLYMNYVRKWQAKGYVVDVAERSRFKEVYDDLKIVYEQTGKQKENVVRELARQSIATSASVAQEAIRGLRNIAKQYKEDTGEKLNIPTQKELIGMSAKDAFDTIRESIPEGYTLTLSDGTDLDDPYRITEAMFYPEKAARRISNLGKTRQEIVANANRMRAEKHIARAKAEKAYKEKHDV